MYPLSFAEMVANTGLIEEKRMLQQRLVYGYYPDVVCNAGDERAILSELSNSYLYKDILLLDKIKKSEKLIKLLQALAFQVGSEVSFNELSQICGLDPQNNRHLRFLARTVIHRFPTWIVQPESQKRIEILPQNLFLGLRNPQCDNQQLQINRLQD